MFSERKFSIAGFKFRWIALISLLLGIVLFTTFNEALLAETHPAKIKTVNQALDLPLYNHSIGDDYVYWHMDQIRKKDTLRTIFSRLNINDEAAIKTLMTNSKAKALNRGLQLGRLIKVKTDVFGRLLHLEYQLDKENLLVAHLQGDELVIENQAIALQRQEVLKSGVITSSLFGATDAADISDRIAVQMAEILSDKIDFFHDIRKGDYFNVIYEAYYSQGKLVKTGNILAVEFSNKKKLHQAIHFGEKSGKYSYYTPEGKSIHKSFLRSPLEFTRVTSSFNLKRRHPVLNRIRAHKGVDMAAPIGARIKASGDGVVKFVGRQGGYGRVIILSHPGKIKTKYAHLSRFAKGLRKGQKVEQGDIIGYVGKSGLATGPHLHYEFLLNGVHRDPMKVALPTNIPIDKQYMAAFKKVSRARLAQLAMLNDHLLVASK